ncbi:hypothetical protein M7I_5831 [Glarea lozoyensis 74030]|uniref:Uncharacterized protein n=1 Tax=Glarea lozoyensis (strain ATCC 74030 / MF5533) TaxID=1104152 RepID=H0ESW0_GLAL7|nr:hypothetical protein M7I_5831 [Glarea lozoyensis 74030]
MVIEKLLHERSVSSSAAPLAFFYCARNSAEPERSDPNQVLRAIVKQLASESVKLPIRQALVDEYNARVAKYDALDECDINERWALLSGLQEIIQKSKQLVKVFASSREDGDIIAQMSAVPNITIRASDNGEDIRKFVESEVNRMICTRRLLHGRVSEKLKSKIVSNLSSGAQGMFRWVSLSMQSICDVRSMKVAGDVENAIGKLPSSLRGLYDIIYDQLPIATGDSENAKELTTSQVVRRTFNWILCAQAHLSTAAFISALWIPDADEDAVDNLTKDQVLDACCNLVVHDATADTFRFAHLSVREYLENRSDFNYTYQYGMALSRCFQSFDSPNVDFSKRDWDEEPFTIYARDNIVSHYRRVELAGNDISQDQRILPQNIKTLVEETLVGCCFEKWISAIKKEVGREALTEVKRYRMKQRVCSSNSQWIPLRKGNFALGK